MKQESHCHYHLTWQSKKACSACRASDTIDIVGACYGGMRTVAVMPAQNCSVISSSQITVNKSAYIGSFSADAQVFTSVPEHVNALFARNSSFARVCSIREDLEKDPFIVMTVVLILISLLLLLCIACTFFRKYRTVKYRYNQILNPGNRMSDDNTNTGPGSDVSKRDVVIDQMQEDS